MTVTATEPVSLPLAPCGTNPPPTPRRMHRPQQLPDRVPSLHCVTPDCLHTLRDTEGQELCQGPPGPRPISGQSFHQLLHLQIFCCLWDPNVRGWAGAGVQVGASIPHPIPLCPPCVLLYRPLLSQLPRRRKGSGCNLWGSRSLTDSGLQDPVTTRGPQHPSARR